MPMFYGKIMMQKYLKDPSISFCAIGDVKTDKAPLQETQFVQGRAIDQLISIMYLEGNGGGNDLEISFLFCHVTGDEGFWEKTKKFEVEYLFGHGIKENLINSKESWDKLKEKYNVFHIKKPYKYGKIDRKIEKQWAEALGSERVLHIKKPKACIDVMLGAIAISSGSRTLLGYIEDMKARGQDEKRIKEVTEALKLYSEMLLKNEVKVVRYEVNPLNFKENINEDLNNQNKYNNKTEYLQEIQELVEKLFIEELDEVNNNYRQSMLKINKEKSDSVPKEYLCPITREIMYYPVMTSDGHSFERTAIVAWFGKNDVSPISG